MPYTISEQQYDELFSLAGLYGDEQGYLQESDIDSAVNFLFPTSTGDLPVQAYSTVAIEMLERYRMRRSEKTREIDRRIISIGQRGSSVATATSVTTPGDGLSLDQVDARIRFLVADPAEFDDTSTWPIEKIPTITETKLAVAVQQKLNATGVDTDAVNALIRAGVLGQAQAANTNPWPKDKLPADTVYDADIADFQDETEVNALIQSGVLEYARDSSIQIPANQLRNAPAGATSAIVSHVSGTSGTQPTALRVTPQSTSSVIAVTLSLEFETDNRSDHAITLTRDGTRIEVWGDDRNAARTNRVRTNKNYTFYDAPNTSSEVVYLFTVPTHSAVQDSRFEIHQWTVSAID